MRAIIATSLLGAVLLTGCAQQPAEITTAGVAAGEIPDVEVSPTPEPSEPPAPVITEDPFDPSNVTQDLVVGRGKSVALEFGEFDAGTISKRSRGGDVEAEANPTDDTVIVTGVAPGPVDIAVRVDDQPWVVFTTIVN